MPARCSKRAGAGRSEINEKEVKTMKYVRPEVAVLASAIAAIHGTKNVDSIPDMFPDTRVHSLAAYEADE
jgi:hypothetical protein